MFMSSDETFYHMQAIDEQQEKPAQLDDFNGTNLNKFDIEINNYINASLLKEIGIEDQSELMGDWAEYSLFKPRKITHQII